MTDEKKLWLIEQNAQKTWTLSLVLAQEAARAGEHGRGYAVVAHEARALANKLFDHAAGARFDGGGLFVRDLALMTRFLAVNAMLELIRMCEVSMEFNIPKSMAVFADDLMRIAADLIELDEGKPRPRAIAELASPRKDMPVECLFHYSIGGRQMAEKCANIMEICYFPKAAVRGETLSLRGVIIPIVDCCAKLGLEYEGPDMDWQTVMMINPDSEDCNKTDSLLAVPIDDLQLNAVFCSPPGESVAPAAGHAFAGFARDCWDAAFGGQFVLADWRALREK